MSMRTAEYIETSVICCLVRGVMLGLLFPSPPLVVVDVTG